jgi:hypothetical protein
MGSFDQRRQRARVVDEAAAEDAAPVPPEDSSRRDLSRDRDPDAAWWRLRMEIASIGFGVFVLSTLVIWVTLTQQISVEAVVVILVTLVLGLLAGGQAMKSHRQALLLERRMGEAAATTMRVAESMVEFLRDFALENQAMLSHLVENQKGRVVDELGRCIDDLARMADVAAMRHELAQLKELIGRKIMEIPSGITFPVPRLGPFDAVPPGAEEPRRLPICPACGAAQARLSPAVNRSGIRYTCGSCGHEFSVGITVLLEKHP